MIIQFRDTQFGRLIRFLSCCRWFQYPDELNQDLEEIFRTRSPQLHEPAEGPDIQDFTSPNLGENHVLEEGKNTCLVDWYGCDDEENPQNWPSSWKLFVSFQICLLNFSVYIASSIYVPGEESIMEEFDVGKVTATLGLSLYTVGYAIGPMLWSPMSEIPRIGRNGIYFWTLLGFVLLQLPTGFALDMPMFLGFRLLTGFFGSPSLATGGATIADMYDRARIAYGLCIWGSFAICGPVFGPILGGFASEAYGWRSTIWIITWLNAFVLVMIFLFLPETSAANILYRRAKRLRQATGDGRLRSQSEIDSASSPLRNHLKVLGSAFTLTFSEPIIFFMDLYTALLYGILFIWFESFPLVFEGIYDFELGPQGLVFLGIFVGGCITLPLFLLWLRYGVVVHFNKTTFKPEWVLPPTFFGSATLPVCFFWYGWSAQKSIHWIMPIIGSSFFTVGIITLFNPVLNYLGLAYPRYAASIFAGNALFRASLGAVFPLFARQMFLVLGVGPGNSLLGGVAICFAPLPYIFYKHGEKLRHMSKHARHDI